MTAELALANAEVDLLGVSKESMHGTAEVN